MQRLRITLILSVLVTGVLAASGFSGRSMTSLQSKPRFVTAGGLPAGTAGQPYQYKFEAVGGTPPYTFNSDLSLGELAFPVGITLDGEGNMSGIPETSGQYNFTVTVTDSRGGNTTALFSMNVLTPDGVQGVRRAMMSSAKGPGGEVGLGANYFFQDGDGVWSPHTEGFTASGEPNGVTIEFVSQDDPETGADAFTLSLSTKQLGVPLTAGVYDNAQTFGAEQPGHPGIALALNGAACQDLGDFTVNTVSFDPAGNLETLDVTFTHYCQVTTSAPLTGHIIYGLAPPVPTGNEPTIKTTAYNPKKMQGTLTLTGKNLSKSSLVIDGHQYLVLTEFHNQGDKINNSLIKATELKLSIGVHQVQVVALDGVLSPEFPVTVQ